jgi:hypothetical protein
MTWVQSVNGGKAHWTGAKCGYYARIKDTKNADKNGEKCKSCLKQSGEPVPKKVVKAPKKVVKAPKKAVKAPKKAVKAPKASSERCEPTVVIKPSSVVQGWDVDRKKYLRVKWEELQRKHGLEAWSLNFNPKLRTTAGRCYHHLRVVELADKMVMCNDTDESNATNTLLHETAHAIAGYGAGHGPKWKRIARSIGCTGDRCHTMHFSKVVAFRRCTEGCRGDNMPVHTKTKKINRTDLFCTLCKGSVTFVSK